MENTKLFHGRNDPSIHFLRKTKRPRPPTTDKEEVEDMANCLMLLSRGRKHLPSFIDDDDQDDETVNRGSTLYRCKTCDKGFASFQALGGHRASHRKPGKAALSDYQNPNPSSTSRPRQGHAPGVGIKPNKVHECSVCGSEFGSGQALGGHMRRHRRGNADESNSGESNKKARTHVLKLDLNLPAPEDSDSGDCLYGLGLALSATPSIDCRY